MSKGKFEASKGAKVRDRTYATQRKTSRTGSFAAPKKSVSKLWPILAAVAGVLVVAAGILLILKQNRPAGTPAKPETTGVYVPQGMSRAELEELNALQEAQIEDLRAKQQEVSALISSLDAKVQELIAQRDEELMAAEKEAERAREAAAAAASSGSSSGGSRVYPDQIVAGASGSAQAVINACYTTPSPGGGLCAWWVEDVFERAGVGSWGGNACDLYNYYCFSSDTSAIQPGMIVAVSTYPSSGLGAIYGHVGIYIGNGLVMENIGFINTQGLDTWIASYSGLVTPRWGWMGGVALS